jgi:PrtD family type I secretion system ABC transporter
MENAETVQALGMLNALMARWRARQHAIQEEAHRAADTTEILQNLTRAVRIALQILILGLGAWLVLGGELSSGGMIAASIILGRALSPVERALGAWRSWVSARAALRNLKALFAGAEGEGGSFKLPKPAGRLTVEALSWSPPDAAEPVLKRISLALAPGTTCGIIGPSGSGKSTLCRLIVGAWTPTEGHVRLDGATIASWDRDDLGRHIGYLPQSVELFEGTIARNIARMRDADDADVLTAARLADVHEMILRLPDGYNTDVGVHGHRLSGGQRQRIGLARALFGDPALIVLDEPNSNLDGAGEHALMKALTGLKERGRTILIVSHHPNALRTADKVLVLADGAVAGFGDRDEIFKKIMVPQPQRVVQAVQPATAPAVGD